MLEGSKSPDRMTDQQVAIAMARAIFVRDVAATTVSHGLKDRPMIGQFVPAEPAYYEGLATLIVERVANCPEHAAQDIAKLLMKVEDLACQQVRGIVHMAPLEGYTPEGARADREANNRKLGLPEAA